MNILLEELTSGLPNGREILRVSLRLLAAALFGGIIGYNRERAGKPAGLRTHMLVSLGAAVFVAIPAQLSMDSDDLSRIIQGLAAGIGFLGAGAILKSADKHDVEGLTTAAGIWLTAGIGVAAGLGGIGSGLIATLLAVLILSTLFFVEKHVRRAAPPPPEKD